MNDYAMAYIWSFVATYFTVCLAVIGIGAVLSGAFAAMTARHKGLCGNCYFWAGFFFGPLAWFVALVMPMQSKVLVPREV